MAPINKSKRTSLKAKASARRARAEHPVHVRNDSTSHDQAAPADETAFTSFSASKRDKQRMRHSAFVSRIEKPNKVSKSKRVRRPGKKLNTELQSLLGALPDLGTTAAADDGSKNVQVDDTQHGIRAKMKLTSLKSKPGALKKKTKLDEAERARFALNMAQLASAQHHGLNMSKVNQDGAAEPRGTGPDTMADARASKWAALRGFISQTMEHSKEFTK